MPTPKQIAAECVKLLKAAKKKAKLAGKDMEWSEVQAIIEKAYMPPAATGEAISANPSPFGDPKHIPPTPEQVTAYSASIGYPMNGQAWCDSYQIKDWMVGKVKMKDWQAAVRNWKTSGYGNHGITLKPTGGTGTNGSGKDYTKL